MSGPLPDVGAVVIARNEGERLLRCLESLRPQVGHVVYADSASGDGSAGRVRALGIEVVELDPSRPLNAARGRNAGFERLLALQPGLEYVFFVDGDCLVVPGFLAAARAELEGSSELGAVCGRRRELHSERSLFNRVVDAEWNTPVGEAAAFGGDVLVRARALREAGGYDESMNQGEDPEASFRLRARGWRIRRIDRDMTLHDVALTRWSAWRKRHRRGGYAYAHGAARHRGEPGRYNQRACLSILGWGLVLPLLALAGLYPSGGLSALLLGAYGFLWWRIRDFRMARGDTRRDAALYAALITAGKVDEAIGVLRCLWDLATGRQALTVEYKDDQRERRAA